MVRETCCCFLKKTLVGEHVELLKAWIFLLCKKEKERGETLLSMQSNQLNKNLGFRSEISGTFGIRAINSWPINLERGGGQRRVQLCPMSCPQQFCSPFCSFGSASVSVDLHKKSLVLQRIPFYLDYLCSAKEFGSFLLSQYLNSGIDR